ncbi:MAG: hypothetical protein JW953_24500, partial [Anaerolineae bacterium]|nr:hypothetical protein [Anaerolineae bacterium]
LLAPKKNNAVSFVYAVFNVHYVNAKVELLIVSCVLRIINDGCYLPVGGIKVLVTIHLVMLL